MLSASVIVAVMTDHVAQQRISHRLLNVIYAFRSAFAMRQSRDPDMDHMDSSDGVEVRKLGHFYFVASRSDLISWKPQQLPSLHETRNEEDVGGCPRRWFSGTRRSTPKVDSL